MSSVPGVEKQPAIYDQYVSTLEPKYQEKARNELHEDDYTREPALVQMREFIAKHPQILRCRTDAVFLLRYLRARKFNVVAAQMMLEKYLQAGQLEYDFFVEIDPLLLEPLISKCIFVPLGSDNEGRLVITMRIGQFDTKTTYPEEQSRLISLALETYLDTELYQVNGLVLIMDFQETTMAHFGIWTFPKLKVIINAMNEIVTFRIKEIHIVQLPKYGAILADFAIAGLSEKLRRRIKFHKTLDGLKGSIDESVLPTIYGGKQTLEDANKEFLRRTFQERNRLLKQTEMYIDLSIPSPNAQSKSNSGLQREFAEESVIGSFRQLNVD